MSTLAEIHSTLCNKEINGLADFAKQAESDDAILGMMLDGLASKEDTFRFNCFKILSNIAETNPAHLYPQWQYFVDMLASTNAFIRSIGVRMIADLTAVDRENRFDDMFERFYSLLYDEKVMVSRYLVQSTSKILQYKPNLTRQIVDKLLEIDQNRKPRSQKDLVCADIIVVLMEIYQDNPQQKQIMAFVIRQLEGSSPKGRKAASYFLNTHAN